MSTAAMLLTGGANLHVASRFAAIDADRACEKTIEQGEFMTNTSAIDRLSNKPRTRLANLPTPLEPMQNLSAQLDADIWVKRDDLTGLALGGNKVRKLEFLLGDAISSGCDAVVTFGALQSNHARQTAAACAKAELACYLILTESVPRTDALYTTGGNLLLDELFGAEIHICDTTDAAIGESIAAVEETLASRSQTGRWIPPGGSEPIGALGYVNAGVELGQQIADAGINVTDLYFASATAGTQTGLIIGLGLVGLDIDVNGVAVYQSAEATTEAVTLLAAETAGLIGADQPHADAINVISGHMGEGYGVPTDQMRDALSVFATTEGLPLDPVYSGKAAGAMISDARSNRLSADGVTLFLHTGGTPGIFAYGRDVFP